MSMIQLENLTKRYGTHVAVDGVTLSIAAGETCVLIGPSGCGKTTTLRMINRLVEPTEGRVLIEGQDTRAMRPEELRRKMGYVIQSVGLFDHMTIAQNVGVVPRLLGWPKERIAARVDELLALVGLEPRAFRDKYPRQLSGGQQQRVGVARALAADPPILLMDEPFGALDPITRERLQDELLGIQSALKKTIVFVTHDIDEAIKLGDRIAILKDGKLIQYDTPAAILKRPANAFVRDFVGADRALKSLGLLRVQDVMEPNPPRVAPEASLGEVRELMQRYAVRRVFVTEGPRLVGWVDREDLERDEPVRALLARRDASTIAVPHHTTVREALSVMIATGFRIVAVVRGKDELVGWVPRAKLIRLLEDLEAGEVAS